MTVGVSKEIRQFLVAFYADDGLVQSRDPARLQASLDTLVSLFKRVGLRTNVSKTKTMVCIPGRIRTCQSQETYTERTEGHAEVRKRKALRVGCNVCREDLAAPSLLSHLTTQHGIYRLFVLSWDFVDEDHPLVSYHATNCIATGKFACPVPGCMGTAGTKYGIRRHFRFLHPQDLLNVQGEGRFSKCSRWGMQVNPTATGHQATKTCKAMHAAIAGS